MLETSSVPSLRRPLACDVAPPAPDDDAWCRDAAEGTEPSATVAPARTAFVRKSRRPTASPCASRDLLLELVILFLCGLSRFGAIGLASTFRHFQHSVRQPLPLNRNFRDRNINFPQVLCRELNVYRAQVFFQALKFRRTRNRNNPNLLCEQPRERDLRRRSPFFFRDFFQQVHHRLVRFACFSSEARRHVTEVGGIESSVRVDLARQKACTEGTERNKSDA